MFRTCLIVMTMVPLFAATAMPSQAQSGRGRQLRLQGTLRSESVAPEATNTPVDQKFDPKLDRSSSDSEPVLSRRTKGLIYNDAAANQQKDDGDYHMTKADKRAGWIMLGLLVLTAVIIAHD